MVSRQGAEGQVPRKSCQGRSTKVSDPGRWWRVGSLAIPFLYFPLEATQRPETHACLGLQQSSAPQQVSSFLQALLPQQTLPWVAQNAVGPLPQHCLFAGHRLLPQQIFPPVMQNGLVPVVQHCCFPLHGGEQVWALTGAGRQAATTPPKSAPPINRITPRRDVGLASSRARLSMN